MAVVRPSRPGGALQSPWRDRRGGLAPLKAVTLVLTVIPAVWLAAMLATGSLGPLPFGFVLYQTGLWSLWLLLASLAVTPVRVIFRWTGAIALRRMLGVAGLAYTLAHIVVYFTDRWPIGRFTAELMRRPTIGVAIAATAGLLVLGATSYDGAIRALGSRAWNQLHNLAYPAIGLAILHFAMSPFSVSGPPFFMVGMFIWLMAWRFLYRAQRGADPVALTVLSLGAGVAAFLFTVGWLVLYQGRPALGQADVAFTLGGGLAPEWQVVLTGLAVALLAACLRGEAGLSRGAVAATAAALDLPLAPERR
jgi:sulfoxide reductase heme-binding subunit YedZ